jgi:ribosomal protein S18 acetylase RimI-like enzyme
VGADLPSNFAISSGHVRQKGSGPQASLALLDGALVDAVTPPESFAVRPFRSGDRDSLQTLWARVFPDDPPWNAPELMIGNKLKVQPELLLVGDWAGTIVGAVIAGFDGVRGWIYHLAVAPEHRRRGFATALVRAAEQGLQDLGCPKVNLQIRPTNQEVVSFYRGLGYQVEDRVSMGRRLEGGS